MTFDERTQAVAKMGGFTERQARFLVTVMLHADVCVPRQYATFCGIVHGQKTRKFFAKLVRLGFASMYDCRHNRARIYHLHQKALYRAIGQAESRLRRPLTLDHAIQRLDGPRRHRDESRHGVAGDGGGEGGASHGACRDQPRGRCLT